MGIENAGQCVQRGVSSTVAQCVQLDLSLDPIDNVARAKRFALSTDMLILVAVVTLSSVTLNFELKKVVLSSCFARLLLVPVHFIESEH